MSSCHQSTIEKGFAGNGRILLMGNPNVGKSVIFHHLTGKYATVSNYPGTTVDITSARASYNTDSLVVDSPGVNSLIPHSEDERVARDLLLEQSTTSVLQVADAKNLRRGLLLTTQLAEAGVPMALALNMTDEAQQKGICLDAKRLSERIGVPVVSTIAVRGQGVDKLKEVLSQATPSTVHVTYDSRIEAAIAKLESLLPELPVAKRFIAIMLLCADKDLKTSLSNRVPSQSLESITGIASELQLHYARPLAYVINRERSRLVKKIEADVTSAGARGGKSIAEACGRWSVHPVAGIPILLLVLLALYWIVGVIGAGTVVGFVEEVVFGEYINPATTRLFSLLNIPFIQELFVGQYGLVTIALTYAIAIILPVVGFFFVCFSLLEDIGYLPRLAVMSDSIMKRIGLSGRAVLPMILGLGCDTMATLTTRTLESKRDRTIATLLLALGIPCSAQLAIILALLAGTSGTAIAVFMVVIISQVLLVGFLASVILPGKRSDFLIEVPPLRVPHLSNIAVKTFSRMKWYFKEAVPLFILGTLVLFVMDKVGVLAMVERAGAPIVQKWLGLPGEATSSFIFGFLRRDYGAAGFLMLKDNGMMSVTQIVVAITTITLFIPCIANLLVIFKERGWKTGAAMVVFIFPFAVLVGGMVNLFLRATGITT